jgi:SAM-dependent methyltransferase
MEPSHYLQMFESEDRHWWFVSRRRIIASLLKSRLTKEEDRSVLELGCGTGGNLRLLSGFGTVSATEMDARARAMAQGRGICPVQDGALPDRIPFERSFDLICLLDVLEHVEDDLAALRSIAARLASSGNLLLTVPAYRFLWSKLDVDSHHKRRYTRRQLIGLLKDAGLKPVYASYFNTLLFPLILLVRLGNLLGLTAYGTDDTVPPKLVNVVMRSIFSLERLLIPRIGLPFGVSIVVMARKASAKTPVCQRCGR